MFCPAKKKIDFDHGKWLLMHLETFKRSYEVCYREFFVKAGSKVVLKRMHVSWIFKQLRSITNLLIEKYNWNITNDEMQILGEVETIAILLEFL